jgi:hypothetical protein
MIGTGSGSCPLVGVGLSSVEPLGLAAEVFVLFVRLARGVSYFHSGELYRGLVGYDTLWSW